MPVLIECVPNFSEGRDPDVIAAITRRIASVPGATLLHVDSGKATNRTVVTFAGEPAAVIEAAFEGIRAAAELIDMREHQGEHPRMGATDVCPLVPISEISMEETARYARQLAERVGRELGIPVYLYEAAQPDPAAAHWPPSAPANTRASRSRSVIPPGSRTSGRRSSTRAAAPR